MLRGNMMDSEQKYFPLKYHGKKRDEQDLIGGGQQGIVPDENHPG
jgi:hypothetical protein